MQTLLFNLHVIFERDKAEKQTNKMISLISLAAPGLATPLHSATDKKHTRMKLATNLSEQPRTVADCVSNQIRMYLTDGEGVRG